MKNNFKFEIGEYVWCPSISGDGKPYEIIDLIGGEVPVLSTKYLKVKPNTINKIGHFVSPLSCFKVNRENKYLLGALYEQFEFNNFNSDELIKLIMQG